MNRGGMNPLLRLYQKEFLPFLGWLGRDLFPFPPICHPEEQSDEGSPIQLRGLDITPSRLPQMKLKSFREKFERGTFTPFDRIGDFSLRSK